MLKPLKLFLPTVLMFPFSIWAQEVRTITGTVVDQFNEPIIGAFVSVDGTKLTAVTDIEGKYEIKSVPQDAVIRISYVGMVPQEIKTGDQTVFSVTMLEDHQMLQDLVVIGYGSAKAKDLTAPIEIVKGDQLVNIPSSSPMAALQGKIPGVTITNSGTPGDGARVQVRGIGSFSDSNPLYVVDGMFYDNINFLNNADIQEMSVLKDASAAAIYGVRAANGVVIITTKKGARNSGARISYEGYIGFQKASNLLEMCDSHEYATMLMEANPDAYRSILQNSVNLFGGDMSNLSFKADTDWYDQLLRTATITNHSLSISGGGERASYALGMSYLYQNGIMNAKNDYSRFNLRASLDYDATSWLKTGFNGVCSRANQTVPNNSTWQAAFNMPGLIPVYDDNRGEEVSPLPFASPTQIGMGSNFVNPIATAEYFDSTNKNYQALTNFYAQLNFLPERLNLRSSYSFDYTGIQSLGFTPQFYVGSNQQTTTTSLTKSNSTYTKWIWDNVLTYTDRWHNLHNFTAMAGISAREENYRHLSGTATGVPEGKEQWKYLNLGNKEGATVSDDGTRYRGLSYFTRLNYNYDNRYFIMATFRADGSSKYNEKWGYFPSVGVAWAIGNENFMKNSKIFDNLKLRASWGKLGNDRIGASAGFNSASVVQSVFGTNNAIDGFLYTSNFSWLAWEVVNETNIGLNFATLSNRLSGDIDWYYRLTDNAVISRNLPMQSATIMGNFAQILNTGVDISLNWTDAISKEFSYNVGATLAYLHNEVKKLRGGGNMLQSGALMQKVGCKLNSYYGYKVIGIYQTQEECASDPIAVAYNFEPGDFKYEDVNKDGMIDGEDKQILGAYIPDLTYGFNLGLEYKGLDFSLSCYGQAGADLWNRKRALRYAQSDYNFDRAQFTDRWTGPGSTNSNPSAAALMKTWNVSDSNNASYFMESADYFRIQNITLGYTFRNIKLGSYTLPRLRLSATADRPFTTFSAHCFTPEISDATGWDSNVYPLTATYTFGLQIDF